MAGFVDTLWYGKHPLQWILRPLSWGFAAVSQLRSWYLLHYCQKKHAVPVIVVGNITVGGVGKTPLVIEIAKQLRDKGVKVGLVSRGYKAQVKTFPYEIQLTDQALNVGDEPLLIAQKTGCPVVIAPQRNQAVDYLIHKKNCQVIISDDGLQHYKMGRAIEIAVIDGTRGLGNGWCLPAGPLREPESRLEQVDFVVVNQGHWGNAQPMVLKPEKPVHLTTGKAIDPQLLVNQFAAVAAIGNPQRFYSTLTQLGIKFNSYSYPDHYQFTADDLNYPETLIIMTEKDAVKCYSFQTDNMYYLPVTAELDNTFWDALWSHQHLKGYI